MLMSVVQVHLSPPDARRVPASEPAFFIGREPYAEPSTFMALKSTIFTASLQLADIDHGYYADPALTLARHPSETDERMMVRLAALALNAHELVDTCGGVGTLAFG